MRSVAVVAVLSLYPQLAAADKLGFEDRVELTRGLMAEYCTAKVLLPRSKKALEFDSNGTYDKKAWGQIAKESGPAARTGDQVQITKVTLERDKILFEINGGIKSGRKWYDRTLRPRMAVGAGRQRLRGVRTGHGQVFHAA